MNDIIKLVHKNSLYAERKANRKNDTMVSVLKYNFAKNLAKEEDLNNICYIWRHKNSKKNNLKERKAKNIRKG